MIPKKECYYWQERELLEERNRQQDDNHEELKAMVQEVSSKQDELHKKLEKYEYKLENGFAERLVNQMQERNIQTFDRLFALIEQKNHVDYQILLKLLGRGGIIAGLIAAVITIISKIM